MHAWRIAKARDALDRTGAGAAIKGFRWNSPNIHAIYAGLTPEIAAMEKLVHAGSILPADLVMVPARKRKHSKIDLVSSPRGRLTLRSGCVPAECFRFEP